jgi:hypothetical protein
MSVDHNHTIQLKFGLLPYRGSSLSLFVRLKIQAPSFSRGRSGSSTDGGIGVSNARRKKRRCVEAPIRYLRGNHGMRRNPSISPEQAANRSALFSRINRWGVDRFRINVEETL